MNIEKANYVRILRLLLDIGTSVYREIFITRIPSVSSYGSFFKPLKSKLWAWLNDSQRGILFPSNGTYGGDLTDLDISVFYVLFRNICYISPPTNGWGKEPDDSDRSIAANIERIRIIRNKYVSHSPSSKISSCEFNKEWEILKKSIIELSGKDTYQTQIDELLTTSLDPESEQIYKSAVESMYKKERSVKQLLQLFEEKSLAIEKDSKDIRREQKTITEKSLAIEIDAKDIRREQRTITEKSLAIEKDTKDIRREQKIITEMASALKKYRKPNTTENNMAVIKDKTIQQWKIKLEKFVETSFCMEVFNALFINQIVLLIGSSGSGKTATAFYLAQVMDDLGYNIHIARSPIDIRTMSSNEKEIFIFDDFLGRVYLNRTSADLWELYDTDTKCLLKQYTKVKLLLITRPEIDFKNALKDYSSLHISEHTLKLSLEERRRIALNYMPESDSQKIDDTTILMHPFFPFICTLYEEKKHTNILDFFSNPYKSVYEELQKMSLIDKLSILALKFLVIYNNRVNIEHPKHFDRILNSICEEFEGEIDFTPTRTTILSQLEKMENIYTSKVNGSFQAIHEKMFDIISAYLGPKIVQSILKYGSINFIADRMLLESLNDRQEQVILVPRVIENLYIKRMLRGSNESEYWESFGNIQSSNSIYRRKFLYFLKLNKQTKFPQKDGLHPLYVSSFLGYTDFVQYLLNHQIRLINYPDSIGRTPLYAASRNGFIDIVQRLISNGADVNFCAQYEWSPLIIATYKGHSKIVKILLQSGAYANMARKLSPLYIACQKGFLDIVQYLLKYNASTSYKNELGWTALHIACQNGHTKIVKELVKAGCNINVTEHKQWSALHVACANGHTTIVKILLQCKNIMIDQEVEKGGKAIDIAKQYNHTEIVNMLTFVSSAFNPQPLNRRRIILSQDHSTVSSIESNMRRIPSNAYRHQNATPHGHTTPYNFKLYREPLSRK
ncbi:uncharacterized protein [Mytilus edulis]|uniref:uncharacterized protein n=1 Tax=Mytilus edulis TaxID=6550 RepID=UPI0039EE84FF